jgi:hypothetical protein
VNSHQHESILEERLVDFTELENIRGAVPMADDRKHPVAIMRTRVTSVLTLSPGCRKPAAVMVCLERALGSCYIAAT